MKFDIQSRENTLILNTFGNYDLIQNFGPIIEVCKDFMKFGTKNKLNILIEIHYLDSGQILF